MTIQDELQDQQDDAWWTPIGEDGLDGSAPRSELHCRCRWGTMELRRRTLAASGQWREDTFTVPQHSWGRLIAALLQAQVDGRLQELAEIESRMTQQREVLGGQSESLAKWLDGAAPVDLSEALKAAGLVARALGMA